jgi:hypothetical protein
MFDFPWPHPLEAYNRYQPNGYPPNTQVQYQPSSYVSPIYGSGRYHKPVPPAIGTAYHPRPILPTPQASVSPPEHDPPPINHAQKATVTKSGKKVIQPTFLGGESTVTTSSSNAKKPTTPTKQACIEVACRCRPHSMIPGWIGCQIMEGTVPVVVDMDVPILHQDSRRMDM